MAASWATWSLPGLAELGAVAATTSMPATPPPPRPEYRAVAVAATAGAVFRFCQAGTRERPVQRVTHRAEAQQQAAMVEKVNGKNATMVIGRGFHKIGRM